MANFLQRREGTLTLQAAGEETKFSSVSSAVSFDRIVGLFAGDLAEFVANSIYHVQLKMYYVA